MADLIKALPQDLVERKRLRNIVEEGIECIRRIKDEESALKDILSVEKEDHGYDSAWLKRQIGIAYDRMHNAEKKRAAIEQKAEEFYENDILFGNKPLYSDEVV